MKRPTWVTVIGILGIIFGISGLFGSGMEVLTPKMLKIQKEMFSDAEKMEKMTPKGNEKQEAEQQIDRTMENLKRIEKMMADLPGWFNTWSIIIGILGLLMNALYICAAIAILQVKNFAIKLFYAAIAISIGHTIVRQIIYAKAFPPDMAFSMMFVGLSGVVLNIILSIVVATGDKKAFVPGQFSEMVVDHE